MINVTGTLINLYQVCKRETWLHANGIRMEHTFYEKSSPGMGREDERDDKTPEVGKKCQLQAFD